MAERVSVEERIARRITIDPITGCHNWHGYRDEDGYGQIKVDGVKIAVHRVTYALYVGDLIDGMHVDHTCRNRACCNADHLEQVTPLINTQRGLSAKLAVGTVAIIKTRLADGDLASEVAFDFGVSKHAIYNIQSGRTWRNVAPAFL